MGNGTSFLSRMNMFFLSLVELIHPGIATYRLGTTRAAAGSDEVFEKIDREYVYN